MNLNDNPTKDQLASLLAACDDRAGHHALWVDDDGEVRITKLPRIWPPPEVDSDIKQARVRVETFHAGNGYVGPEAAANADWVAELFGWLTRDWAAGKNGARPALIGL